MRRRSNCHIEALEIRMMLAQVGLDLTFGDAGAAPVGGDLLVAPVADGKILAVSDHSATRLNADGSVDPGFQLPAGVLDLGELTVIKNATRLFVAGDFDNSLIVRAFHLSDGSADTTFGASGTATIDFPPIPPNVSWTGTLASARATPDGGLLLYARGKLYKLDATGKLDTTFGNNGALQLNVGPDVIAHAEFDVAPNGKIVALNEDADGSDVTLDRFNADGTPDTAFGTNGTSAALLGRDSFPFYYGLFATADAGALVLIGSNADGFEPGEIGRVKGDGTYSLFADSLDPDQNDTNQLFVQSDGKVLGVAGAALFRFNGDGSPDTSFDNDGIVWIGGDAASDRDRVATDDNGDVLVAGKNTIARYAILTTGAQLAGGRLQINGTASADTITVAAAADQIIATVNGQQSTFAGADVTSIVIRASDGNDVVTNNTDLPSTIYGGEGDDTITGGARGDSLLGQGGNDRISGRGGDDYITGESGRDTLYGNGGADSIFGGRGNDRLSGSSGRDRLYGGGGNDRLYGGASGDWLYSQGGSDQLFGEGGNDRLYVDYNNDNQDLSPSSTVHGGAGNDTLVGANNTVDQLFGDAGHDTAAIDINASTDPADVLTSIEGST